MTPEERLQEKARELCNIASHAVCTPRMLYRNEGHLQQHLGRAITQVRTALQDLERVHTTDGERTSER